MNRENDARFVYPSPHNPARDVIELPVEYDSVDYSFVNADLY